MITEVFVLTHKEIDIDYDEDLYKPLICGAEFNKIDCNYLKDNTGDNISNLNSVYAELTGMYWAWKNTTQDIIGFCHYRRWWTRFLICKKLKKNDIEKILDDYDVILPSKWNIIEKNQYIHFTACLKDHNFSMDDLISITDKIIEKEYPEYSDAFQKALHDKKIYSHNMFICRKELADDFFEWYFKILEKVFEYYDFEVYDVKSPEFNITLYKPLAYLAEILTDVYMKKNNFKIKELPFRFYGPKFPLLAGINRKYPFINWSANKLYNFFINLKFNHLGE